MIEGIKIVDGEKSESDLIHELKYRNPVQILVFKKLDLDNDDIDRILIDRKIVSDFIDNPKNTEVRGLILQKKFEEAADLIVTEIKKEEHWPKAA